MENIVNALLIVFAKKAYYNEKKKSAKMREYDFEFVQTVCTNWLYTKDLLNEEDAESKYLQWR